MTTIIGAAFFSAIRLSRIRFARPNCVHAVSSPSAPCSRYSTGSRAGRPLVIRRRVDIGAPGGAGGLRRVVFDADGAVRNGLHVVEHRARPGHVDDALNQVRPAVVFDDRVSLVEVVDAVDGEVVLVDVGFDRAHGDAPHAVGAFRERGLGRQALAEDRHLRGVRRANAEGDAAVSGRPPASGRPALARLLCLDRRGRAAAARAAREAS